MILSQTPTRFLASEASTTAPSLSQPKYSGLIPIGSLPAMYCCFDASYSTRANSASISSNMCTSNSLYMGRRISQSESLLKV